MSDLERTARELQWLYSPEAADYTCPVCSERVTIVEILAVRSEHERVCWVPFMQQALTKATSANLGSATATDYVSAGRELGELGELVTSKQRQYGDSAGRAGAIMRVLYPSGVAVHQYDDALLVVRVLDKLSRIAQRGLDGRDLGGESPWRDIAGYGLLGAAMEAR